jgi:hypothetical protein
VARLTRREKATGAGAGLLLGVAAALIGQVLNVGLAVTLPLIVIFAAGLGAFLASVKHGIW